MNTGQAIQIMEQATMLAIRSTQSINDAKLIISAWETIKARLTDVDSNSNSDDL